jgi:hypothetical protein
LTTPDVNVFLIDFQAPGKEMVVSNEDGSYTVLINARLSQDERLNAYRHALGHISEEDFEKPDIQSIELQAHGLEQSREPAPVPADEYEKRIRQLQKKRKKIQKAQKEREKEIKLITELYGPDCFFRAAEYRWLYGESD